MAAFDQSGPANSVYEANHPHRPTPRNLRRIPEAELPAADLWWMSPPCTPFTSRGARRDDDDPRAAPLLRLIELIPRRRPPAILLENVAGFATSRCRERLLESLGAAGYGVAEVDLDPTRFGVPMRRPRRFLAARLGAPPELPLPELPPLRPLASFLDPFDESLRVPGEVVGAYGAALDVVDADDPAAVVSTVTRAYARSWTKSGSLVRQAGQVRRLSPEEILRLLGFPERFRFPDEFATPLRFRLVGNSIDVRAAAWLLDRLR